MGQDDNHWCELGFAEPAVVFKGPTQTARSVTEAWVALHGFCPNCSADRLPQLPNNSPVADFRCDACGEEYELKAKRGKLGRSIPDGAFSTMTARLAAANNPSLFAMSYDRAAARVTDLIFPFVILRQAAPSRRRPGDPAARESATLSRTPPSTVLREQIAFGAAGSPGLPPLSRGSPEDDERRGANGEVRAAWTATRFLRDEGLKARGWLLAVMGAVEAVGRPEFALAAEVYAQEARLAALYPGNNNLRPKIRQQLQVLRDRGWLAFDGRGRYRRTL